MAWYDKTDVVTQGWTERHARHRLSGHRNPGPQRRSRNHAPTEPRVSYSGGVNMVSTVRRECPNCEYVETTQMGDLNPVWVLTHRCDEHRPASEGIPLANVWR